MVNFARRAIAPQPWIKGDVMTVRLEAVEYGAGPPLAILHGLFGSGRNWAGVAQRLAAHHRVVQHTRGLELRAFFDQQIDHMAADEAGAPRDERGLAR